MKAEILALLREKKTYVSGQHLCEQFCVSRTAVWKAIKQLQKEGYPIEAVPKLGYILREDEADALEEKYCQSELASRMTTKWVGKQVHFYETIDSTNLKAKALAEAGAQSGTLVVADQQTAGRGRRGRTWISPKNTNIYFTILLRPEISTDCASMLTLVIAHALADTFRNFLGLGDMVSIKWPNDIIVSGRKVCGILTEMSLEQSDIQHVVIGVGINVRKQEFAPEIADRAIALDEAMEQAVKMAEEQVQKQVPKQAEEQVQEQAGEPLGKKVDRVKLLSAVMEAFERDYELFMQKQSLELLMDSYNRFLVNKDREVCVLDPAGEYRGIARGITDKGELLVELSDGELRLVFGGEVSVRGVYGYV